MGGSAYARGGSVVFLGDNYFYQHSGWSSAGRAITAGEFLINEGDSDISAGYPIRTPVVPRPIRNQSSAAPMVTYLTALPLSRLKTLGDVRRLIFTWWTAM